MAGFLDARGVIFDCDGTLLDSIGAWEEMEQMLCDRAGVEKTPEVSRMLATLTSPEAARWLHEDHGLGESNQAVERMMEEFMMDFYQHRAQPRPGAVELVQRLYEDGVRMTLASSTPHDQLVAGMQAVGLERCFVQIVSTDDVGASKRERKIYDYCLDVLGTPKELTWGAEDAIYAIRTLKGAGYHSLGILDQPECGTWEQLSAEADVAIRSWEELL